MMFYLRAKFSHMSHDVFFFNAMFRAWLKWVVREGALFCLKLLFFPPAHPGICDPDRYVPASKYSVSLALATSFCISCGDSGPEP